MVLPFEQLDVTTFPLDHYAQSPTHRIRSPSTSLSKLVPPIPAFSDALASTCTVLDDYRVPSPVEESALSSTTTPPPDNITISSHL